MNFLVISPQFPATNWNFCDRLKLNGINTLGIGHEPYEELRIEVRHALQDYIQIQQYQSYDAVLRAAAFFTYRYGRINGMDSFQESRLFSDARLRTDFHVGCGSSLGMVQNFLDIGTRRAWAKQCGVPVAFARRAVSLHNAVELLKRETIMKLYDARREQVYTFYDEQKLTEAFKTELQDCVILPQSVGSLYIWEALLDHTGIPRITASKCLDAVCLKHRYEQEKKELSAFAEEACVNLTGQTWSSSFLHMIVLKQQDRWELLDVRIGADRCHLLNEKQDMYQLWADCMCEDMEYAGMQEK